MNLHVHVLLWFQNLRSVATGLSPGVSHSVMDQGVSMFAAGMVRGGHRMPVIVESCRPRNVDRWAYDRWTYVGVIGGEP